MQATDAPTQAIADELVLSLGAVMRHLMTTTGRSFFHEVERLGLSLSQVKTLQVMADREPSTLKSISDELGLSLPGVSRAVDGLHKRGLVKRVEDPEDRRAKRVSLTAKGRRTFAGLLELRLAGLRDFVAGLDPRGARRAGGGSQAADGAAGDRRAETRRQAMTSRIRLNDANRRWWTLGAMCFALFMIMLDNTVVNVALPSIQDDLGASLSALEWTVNAYTLSFAVLLVTGGRLGDIFGRRRMFLFGVVVFAALERRDRLRALAGVAGGRARDPGHRRRVHDARHPLDHLQRVPRHERGRAIGTWAGVSALALAIGPVVGGALTEHVSWRAIFFLNLPVAAGAVAVTLFAAHESRDETVERRVDWTGIGTLSVGLTALVLALVEGNQWGWGSAAIVALLATAVVGLGAFAVLEPRVRAPMVDFDFFRSRTFFGANLVAFVVTFAMLAMFFFTALYMQNFLGYSPLEAGLRFLPATALIIVTAPIAGRLADRVGPRRLMTGGLLVVAVAMYLQTHITVNSGYGMLLPAFMLMGLGMGFVMSPMSTAAMNAVNEAKAGRRVGDPVDEPDGGRHLRRRRPRGAVPAPQLRAPGRLLGGHRRDRRAARQAGREHRLRRRRGHRPRPRPRHRRAGRPRREGRVRPRALQRHVARDRRGADGGADRVAAGERRARACAGGAARAGTVGLRPR